MDSPAISHILNEFSDCTDLTQRSYPHIQTVLLYFGHLVGNEELNRDVIAPLTTAQPETIDILLQQSQFKQVVNSKEIITGILNGQVALFHINISYLVDVSNPPKRSITPSETESVVTGPHDSFVESANTNLSLIRKRVKSPHLKAVKFSVGEITKSDVYVLYLKDIANPELIRELTQRIKRMETSSVFEANMFVQLIDDHPYSIFPQFITTERPDVAVSKLVEGKIVCIVDNSPAAISAPTGFFEFFASPDDYYQRWALGTGLRILRFLAFLITVSFTAFYVSITTFHYEMVPQPLLLNLAESRAKVPFPPLFEALLMEITIELLREAGARLPTKIGQTIGIVGGIVIGQAAVQAGLTSNILIISVASSAIASFVIPSYIMSASIRLLRFGLIILAGIWGNLGLMFGVGLIVIHLSGLTNLNTSYLTPVAPMNASDWLDTFIRGPFQLTKRRPSQAKPQNRIRAPEADDGEN